MKLARAAAYPVQVPSADWSDEQLRTAWAGSAVPDAVERLEAELGRFLKLDVIATGSARTALYLVLRAVAESMGRVLVPAFTCVAVPNACVAAGVPVRWLDVDGVHMDFALAAGDLRPTDTLLEQHTFGITPPRGHGWAAAFVIEDRAHRFDGADIEGQAAVFSLEHSKVYSAGHGGRWVRDPVLRARIRRERDALPLPSSAEARRVLRTSAAQRALATGGVHRGVRSIARRVAFRVPGLSMPAQSGDELAGLGIRPTRLHPMYATVALQGIHDAGRRSGSAIVWRRFTRRSWVAWCLRQPVTARRSCACQCSSKMPRLSGASCANAGSISASHGSAHQSIRPAAAAHTRPAPRRGPRR